MFKGFGRSGGRGAMAAGAFAALVLALGLWIGTDPEPTGDAPETPEAVAVAPQPEADPQKAALPPDAVQGASIGPDSEAATEPRPQEQAEAEKPQPPAFDEVRRESDGMTVIAGRAAPGSSVFILKDGEEVARATADPSGKFATLAMIPPDGAGHVLTLRGEDGGTQVTSDEEIILAPLAAPQEPIELAEADTTQEPVPPVAETAPEAAVEADEEATTEDDATADSAPAEATPLAETGTTDSAGAGPDAATPAQATPLPQAGTAEAEAPAVDAQRETAQATPLAETGTAAPSETATNETTDTTAADGATPLAQTGTASTEAETPEDAATPLADTAPAPADPASGEAPETAETAAPAEATPLAETGTESAATDSAIPETTPLAGTGTAESNDATPAPQVAETPPAAPDRPDTNGAPVAPDTIAEAQPSADTAPEKPAAPAPATAPVAVLKSTAEGVERIDTAPPQVMTNVALDTIGYSDAGDVQLAGRAQPDTREVRVYLDNDAIISLPVDQEGRWRGDLPDVDEGVYTLRVDELSAAGDVTSRVETPFKRESPEALAAASANLTGPLAAVTVQKGDTLWAISRERYGDPLLYVKVFEANSDNIRDPDLIYPGQVFDLPEDPATE